MGFVVVGDGVAVFALPGDFALQNTQLNRQKFVKSQSRTRRHNVFGSAGEVDGGDGAGQINQPRPLTHLGRQGVGDFAGVTVDHLFDEGAGAPLGQALGQGVDGHQAPHVDHFVGAEGLEGLPIGAVHLALAGI